ncbi:MAG: zinc dependent phospholipase C family protein [Flectobacillus sp.]|uniref:zinc dependent phospholipase C family protein n=1 Tax=Flectobacillus sp. TaxID=50419 RepID=UPI003B9A5E0E
MKPTLLVRLLALAFWVCYSLPTKSSGTSRWGFFGHQLINRLAVFTLPPEMITFYKKHLPYLIEHSVDPDKRRYAIPDEAPRHFIDLDYYGDSAIFRLQKPWEKVVEIYSEDTLKKHGIVPWHISFMKYRLTKAFETKNLSSILKCSAEIGHYIGDANVPLHTTSNYNGQKTQQVGIHGFWESRLPELFSKEYDFFVGKAEYVKFPQKRIWTNIQHANQCLDSVFRFEKTLQFQFPKNKQYSIDERNLINTRAYSFLYSKTYHELLNHQVERQMRAAVKMLGDFWYTCWIDAGQPDLNVLSTQSLSDSVRHADEQEAKSWLKRLFSARDENE